MKHVGVCSVLIACCLAAPAWAVRFGEKEPGDGAQPVPLPDAQVQVVDDENYAPWQVYGNGNPYDQSAIAQYNSWPQVCTDGLWDNFCNEQHCHCYKGPKQHCGHGHHLGGGCNSCGTAACGCGKHGLHGYRGKKFINTYSAGSNCAGGDCAGSENATSVDAPTLEMQPTPEPTLQPQPVPEPPAAENASARLLPRANPIRQHLTMPSNWKGVK